MANVVTRQAQNEAALRFGPQRFALRELLMQAMSTRDLALRAAAGADRGIQSSLTAARTETAHNYADAAQAGTGTSTLVNETLAKLGAAADPFRAALAREGGLGADRMTASRTNALQDLTQRRLESASGRAYASSAATRQFSTDVGKVQRSYQELANEQGAFTQGRTGELRKEAADRAFTRDLAQMRDATSRRGQNISHQDRQAAINQRDAASRRTAANKGKNRNTAANRPRSGVGSLTQGEENSVKDDISSVLSVITNPPPFEDAPKGSQPGAKGPRLTKARMLQHLRNGTNPLGKPVPDDIIKIAYDLQTNNGVLSPNGVKLVHSRGMHVPKEWLPKPRTEQFGPSGAILPGR